LTEIAAVKDNQAVGEHGSKMPLRYWNGAIRGEYRVTPRLWDCLCPVWHTGQAVKALVSAAGALNRAELLEDAEFCAEFIMRNRIVDGKDQGLILAFEDHPDKVNTSAVLEAIDGLFLLSETAGKMQYRKAALDALRWVKNNAWQDDKKIFYDIYDPVVRKFVFGVKGAQGRPLLDDALFVKGWRLTGDESFKQIAVDTAETLLKDEKPAGNWIKYIPCDIEKGNIHPRHAYWWGMPMLEVYKATDDERFLQCYFRSVEWYKKAMRKDGGFFRGIYTDFNSDSFGHATSGTACAVISFLKYYEFTKDEKIVEYIERGLNYCMKMQFTNPEDPNLKGAILEKVLPPDGTDRSPYHIRDLGTIFFIQAASLYLQVFWEK
jgi:rhamnogalacturonyl hydrolase YesR